MKIVIDIDEKEYKLCKARVESGESVSINTMLIANGMPLPDTHGDLIDREYFTDKYAGCGSVYCEDTNCKDCNSKIVNKFDVDSAPTIIPADK